MDLLTWVQILDVAVCIAYRTNTAEKGMHLIILLPAMDKIVTQTGLLNLDMAT